MPDLWLMSGVAGVGKTTYARELAETRGLVYVGIDDFYQKVNGSASDRSNPFEVWQSLFVYVHELEVLGVSCVVDTAALTRSQRDQFLDWFPSFRHHLVYLDASEGLCAWNNKSRARVVPEDVFESMWEQLEVPVWNELDERWVSFTHVRNEANNFKVLGCWCVD